MLSAVIVHSKQELRGILQGWPGKSSIKMMNLEQTRPYSPRNQRSRQVNKVTQLNVLQAWSIITGIKKGIRK